jgi:anthranilate synthase component I
MGRLIDGPPVPLPDNIMLAPSFDEFTKLATQGNFIPVYRELLADLQTPVSAWYRVCRQAEYSFLLESVEGGEKVGRYSLLGCDPLWTLTTRGPQTVQQFRDGKSTTFTGNPFKVLSQCLEPYKPVHLPALPPGLGGLFGFWGYELVSWIEPRVPVHLVDLQDLPDGQWMQVDSLLVFDQVKRKIWAIAYADLQKHPDLQTAYDEAASRVDSLVDRLSTPMQPEPPILDWKRGKEPVVYQSSFAKEDFLQAVEKSKAYIKAGDIFQVVLSQRLATEYKGDPFALYRSLRVVNPSPYMAYFNFGTFQMIGSSPEIMVKLDQIGDEQVATLRPIAGTRKRGVTPEEDLALEKDLLADPKETAEHVMLVDLGRNDLGRVCRWGSVHTNEMMKIERYSHVMHIASNVTGLLDPKKSAWDLLQACFPAGTVSGAPKIRAMEIICELEPHKRGPYSGVYGYYSFDGQLNTAITIRTMLLKDGALSVQAGAGIVADSVPEMEYQETINKANGLLEAIAYA